VEAFFRCTAIAAVVISFGILRLVYCSICLNEWKCCRQQQSEEHGDGREAGRPASVRVSRSGIIVGRAILDTTEIAEMRGARARGVEFVYILSSVGR
jgi:hypothetical protein